MKKKPILLFLFYALFFNAAFAQQGEVSVNPLTGAGSVAIPIVSVSSGGVSAPVTLVYNGTGIKTKDVEGTAGIGWQLSVGGQINRLLRGLPDDGTKDSKGNTRLGWMSTSNSGASYARTYTILNNGSSCTNETSDITNINTNIPYTYDTEPDIFYVSAPGLSCQLVYDRTLSVPQFKPVSYQDLAISVTLVGGTGNNASNIASFTITNDKGIKYVFAASENVLETTNDGAGAAYFLTKYNQFQNGINYSDSWNLTSITDPYGNGIQFNYSIEPVRNSTDQLVLYLGGATTKSIQYNDLQAVTPQRISSIRKFNAYNSTTMLTFNWQPLTNSNQTGETVISSITGLGRTFNFTYGNATYTPSGNQRAFLTEYNEPGCSTPVDYKFGYIGNTYTSSTNTWTTTLPDSTSTNIDYWGYYTSSGGNGSLIPTVYVLNPTISYYPRYVIQASTTPGSVYSYATIGSNNRAITAASVATGCLNQITYATGGNTTITYESNDYLDVPSGGVVQGGGVRVKQIVDSDGSGTNNITRNYSYLDPSSGLSSGKPITLPIFAFTIPYNGTATGTALWTNATALSETDLSMEDHTIMYAYAKVSQTGAGSILYNYSIPYAYWDNGAAAIEKIARYSCTATYGPVTQGFDYTYPFIPNPNYDHLRGLPVKITNYNDNGTEASETNYTYSQVGSTSSITAFKSDDAGPSGLVVKGYNQYTISYNNDQLTSTANQKIFDSSGAGNAQSSTVTYTYGSANHRLLTQQQATNSDNSTLTTKITYSKDLTAATGSTGNANITAYYNLRQQNINIPVESYQQVTRGGTTTTVSSSLALFRDTTIGANTLVLPSQQLKWIAPNGGTFTPMAISGSTLTKDAGYFATTNYDQYDNSGYPLTVDDNNKNIATTVLDHVSGRSTAAFKNAAANQVVFSDFDTDPGVSSPCKFTISGSGSYTPVGSHAGNAAGLYAVTQTAASGTLVKNSAAQNYVFSIWVNATAAGTLTLSVTGVTPNPTISYSGGWKYYELKIPAASISSSFTVSFTASTPISIDDVLFYPYTAQASTATYDAVGYYKIAETNTNGVSAYYVNDQWGRLLYALDQDKNIVKRNTYVNPSNISDFAAPTIAYNPYTGITTVTPVTFFATTTTDPCSWNGVLYTWTFGDGTSYQSTSNVNPSHTYAAAGTYTVNLKVSSPLFGSKSATPVTVTVAQAMATVSVINHTMGAGISSITMTSSTNSYSFTSTNLPGQVVPGTYTITFQPSGQLYNPSTGKGMTNVVFSDGGNGACYSWGTGGSHTFTWTVSANDALHFDIYNDNTCPFL